MAERLDIEDFFRETDPDLCQYGYMYYFLWKWFCNFSYNGYHKNVGGGKTRIVFQYLSLKDIDNWF